MLNMDSALPTLIKTRPNFYREQAGYRCLPAPLLPRALQPRSSPVQASLMYLPGAYITANIAVELPWLLAIILTGSTVRAPSVALLWLSPLST